MYNTHLRQRRPSYRKPFLIIMAVIIVVIIFIVFLSVGKVTIAVNPKYETKSVDFNAEIVRSDEDSSNKIPGRVLTTVVRGNETITEVDRTEAEKPATGKVVIHNELDHDQPLVSTTRLLAENGVLFRTKDRVNAKAHSTVEVEVYADEPGPAGEIEPTRFTLPGLWQEWQGKIYASSSEPMTGGFGETDFISEDTINRGKEQALNALKEEGKRKLQQQVNSGEKVLDDAIKIDILSENVSVEPESYESEFSVNAEIRLTAVVFDEDSLYHLAEERLRESIPEDLEIQNLSPDRLSYSLEVYDLDKKTATLITHLEADTISKVSADVFDKSKLVGRTETEIKDYLEREQDVGEIEVSFSPAWLKTVPSDEKRIELEVKN